GRQPVPAVGTTAAASSQSLRRIQDMLPPPCEPVRPPLLDVSDVRNAVFRVLCAALRILPGRRARCRAGTPGPTRAATTPIVAAAVLAPALTPLRQALPDLGRIGVPRVYRPHPAGVTLSPSPTPRNPAHDPPP